MAYATQADLVARFGEDLVLQLADRDRDGTLDAAVADAALADATALIDGYLLTRYSLPLPSVPDILRPIATAIAFRQLHTEGPPDAVERLYKDALAQLDRIARGIIVLDVTPEPGSAAQGAGGPVRVDGPERTFSRNKLRGF
jgi:phage gp36-like protein